MDHTGKDASAVLLHIEKRNVQSISPETVSPSEKALPPDLHFSEDGVSHPPDLQHR